MSSARKKVGPFGGRRFLLSAFIRIATKMATMTPPSSLVGPVRKATSLKRNRPTPGPRKSLMVVLGFLLSEALQDLDERARYRHAAMRAAVRHGQRPCHAP